MKAAAATGTVLAGLLVVGLVQVVPAGASPHPRPPSHGVGRSQRKHSIATDAVPAAAVSRPAGPLAHRSRRVGHAPASAARHPRSGLSSLPRPSVRTHGRSVTPSRLGKAQAGGSGAGEDRGQGDQSQDQSAVGPDHCHHDATSGRKGRRERRRPMIPPTTRRENHRTCTGTLATPGLLAGRYRGTVIVKGYCIVDGGPTHIDGNLVLRPGSAVNATYARNDVSGSGKSRLWVKDNVKVYKGATLLMGCEPKYAPCTDDPNAATGGKAESARFRRRLLDRFVGARGGRLRQPHQGNCSTRVRRGRRVLRRSPFRCLLAHPHPCLQRLRGRHDRRQPQGRGCADLLVRCPPGQGAGQPLLRTLDPGRWGRIPGRVQRRTPRSAMHRGQAGGPVCRFGRESQPGHAGPRVSAASSAISPIRLPADRPVVISVRRS